MTSSSETRAATEPEQRLVATPLGDARLWLHRPPIAPRCLLVVGHGAGRGTDTRDVLALAVELSRAGAVVVRLDQPWVVAGRKVAVPPAQLDVGWLAAVPQVRDLVGVEVPLVVAGRSAGARVACRTATALGAAGAVALAFPLHPPGRPEQSRAGELIGSGVRTLVVQGQRDAFGGPTDVLEAIPEERRTAFRVVPVPYADHSFRVAAAAPVTAAETLATVVLAVGDWLREGGIG